MLRKNSEDNQTEYERVFLLVCKMGGVCKKVSVHCNGVLPNMKLIQNNGIATIINTHLKNGNGPPKQPEQIYFFSPHPDDVRDEHRNNGEFVSFPRI